MPKFEQVDGFPNVLKSFSTRKQTWSFYAKECRKLGIKQKGGFTTADDANTWREGEIGSRVVVVQQAAQAGVRDLDFDTALKAVLVSFEKAGKKPRTIRLYQRTMNRFGRWYKARFGDRPVSQLSRSDVEGYLYDPEVGPMRFVEVPALTEEGNPKLSQITGEPIMLRKPELMYQSQWNEISRLRMLLGEFAAMRLHPIGRDVMLGIKPNARTTDKRTDLVYPWNGAQARVLLENLPPYHAHLHYADVLRMVFWCGVRPGELMGNGDIALQKGKPGGVRWRNLFLDGQGGMSLHIHPENLKLGERGEGGKKGRVIELPPEAVEVLNGRMKMLEEISQPAQPNDPIFPGTPRGLYNYMLGRAPSVDKVTGYTRHYTGWWEKVQIHEKLAAVGTTEKLSLNPYAFRHLLAHVVKHGAQDNEDEMVLVRSVLAHGDDSPATLHYTRNRSQGASIAAARRAMRRQLGDFASASEAMQASANLLRVVRGGPAVEAG